MSHHEKKTCCMRLSQPYDTWFGNRRCEYTTGKWETLLNIVEIYKTTSTWNDVWRFIFGITPVSTIHMYMTKLECLCAMRQTFVRTRSPECNIGLCKKTRWPPFLVQTDKFHKTLAAARLSSQPLKQGAGFYLAKPVWLTLYFVHISMSFDASIPSFNFSCVVKFSLFTLPYILYLMNRYNEMARSTSKI